MLLIHWQSTNETKLHVEKNTEWQKRIHSMRIWRSWDVLIWIVIFKTKMLTLPLPLLRTHTHTYTPILNQIKWYNFSLDFLVLFLYSLCRLGERSTALLLWLLPFCVVYYLYFVRLCRLWWCIQFLCFFATSFFCCCCCFCFAWIALELHKFETLNDSI